MCPAFLGNALHSRIREQIFHKKCGWFNHIVCFLVFHADDPLRLLQTSPCPSPGRGLSGLSVVMPCYHSGEEEQP